MIKDSIDYLHEAYDKQIQLSVITLGVFLGNVLIPWGWKCSIAITAGFVVAHIVVAIRIERKCRQNIRQYWATQGNIFNQYMDTIYKEFGIDK